MLQSEEMLVDDARRGDRAAFEELVRRTSKLVFARLYLDVGDTHRAEDLTQETYITAFRSIRQVRKPEQFRSWLLRIAQNVARDGLRHESRKKRAPPGRSENSVLSLVPGNVAQPVDEMEHAEERLRAMTALRSLPDEYRLPLTMRYLGGLDYESICTQLGLTNGSLRGLLQRGMKMMRNELGDKG